MNEALKSLLNHRRSHLAVPFFSLLWGLWTAWSMQRSQQGALKLAAVSCVFFLLCVFSDWWMAKGPLSFANTQKLKRIPKAIEWLVVSGQQGLAQFLLFFCIPFFYSSGAIPALLVLLVLAGSALWDPFFEDLNSRFWYRGFLRGFCFLASFLFFAPILFPDLMPYLYLVLVVFIFIITFPYYTIFRLYNLYSNKYNKFDYIHLFSVYFVSFSPILLIVLYASLKSDLFRIPISSFWIKDAEISLRYNLAQTYPAIVSGVGEGDEDLASDQLCCWSPLVAPQHFRTKIMHRWVYRGRPIDEISLGEIVGLSDKKSFRTYSCKSKLPFDIKNKNEWRHLRCEVILPFGEASWPSPYLIGVVDSSD